MTQKFALQEKLLLKNRQNSNCLVLKQSAKQLVVGALLDAYSLFNSHYWTNFRQKMHQKTS